MATLPRVLVVSSNPQERERFSALLGDSQAQIEQAEKAAEALELISAGDHFDVVFLGIDSAHDEHDRFLRAAHDWDPALPVVLISTIDDVDFYLECLELGAFDYLPRPVDGKEFLRIYELALRHRCSAGPTKIRAA